MALSLRDCTFFGPALPEPFVLSNLEVKLNDLCLLPRNVGDEGHALQQAWEVFRRKLRDLGEHGGDRRVFSHVLEPLVSQLGYASLASQESVITREGAEDGGCLFVSSEGLKLRVWASALGTDLDAPNRRGRAYRFSPSRVAQRVLLASGERAGLLTDGEELRLLICDPARPDSHISVTLSRSGGWRSARNVPDSYRLFRALASPRGVAALPDLTDAARLAQSQVTKKLRVQARKAIEGFLQEVLDHPENQVAIREAGSSEALARQLWREGLILVYRLLFVFKLESSADPARAFSFAATSLWRRTYSPNTALADIVRKVMDDGADSGGFLEGGLRTLWRMFEEGMSSSELEIKALGGMLFGEGTTPHLDRLGWGERAVARLLDALLWTPVEGRAERERVHYGALDVEDLGRVYEALLELEPGISTEPMCRLRRAKLEVVVPAAQGAPYRGSAPANPSQEPDESDEGEEEEGQEDPEEAMPRRRAQGGRTQVVFIEDIPAGRFFLRVGLGRKATGSYYTPHPFVRFLVQETLGPQLLERSPKEDPQPGRILELKVIDPAMGSGHFLVEACRYLGEALYEACRLCDELAVQAEEQAAKVKEPEQSTLLVRASELRKRVEDLPDPEDELVAYLPSRVPEGEDSGLSQKKAEALCRRLVAVHCLYGVDKNPLAVELAKLSLWLESYAEGLPLTFMDHRLVCGDSLTGPFFEDLLTYPKGGGKLDDLYAQGLTEQLRTALANALAHVRDLEASVGKDVADLEQKSVAKEKLDAALKPLKLLAAAWSGGVMLGDACDDMAYLALARTVAKGEDAHEMLTERPRLREMVDIGEEGVPFELVFPEVFRPCGPVRQGFDAVLGNPPWDTIRPLTKEFFATYDFSILTAPSKTERDVIEKRLTQDSVVIASFNAYCAGFKSIQACRERFYKYQKVRVEGKLTGGDDDLAKLFAERFTSLCTEGGYIGAVLPAAFHSAASSVGLRRLYLSNRLVCCIGFQNKNKLFDIVTNVKFDVVVGQRSSPGDSVLCSFYNTDTDSLFMEARHLPFSTAFIKETGGSFATLIELRSRMDLEVAARMSLAGGPSFAQMCSQRHMRFGRELHATDDAWRTIQADVVLGAGDDTRDPDVLRRLVQSRYMIAAEDDSIHLFDDHWTASPVALVELNKIAEKTTWLIPPRYYRLMVRRIATVVDARSIMTTLVPPGWLSICPQAERQPDKHSSASSLVVLGMLSTHSVDWQFRLRVTATVNLFLLDLVRLPPTISHQERFLAHSALRLTCNHSGFAPLWTEQLSEAWRESKPKHTWPAIEGDDVRWAVRAAIDAVVADTYGLNREQYAHVLSSFSHRSYPRAPELCLAAFDELKAVGLEAFTQKHDPYWDIPLNENLPQPVIDLPIPGQTNPTSEDFGPMFADLQDASAPAPRPAPAPMAPRPSRAEGDPAYDTLRSLLQERGVITSGEAQEAIGLDANGVRPLLRRLVDEGLAETEGQRRGMRYRRLGGA